MVMTLYEFQRRDSSNSSNSRNRDFGKILAILAILVTPILAKIMEDYMKTI